MNKRSTSYIVIVTAALAVALTSCSVPSSTSGDAPVVSTPSVGSDNANEPTEEPAPEIENDEAPQPEGFPDKDTIQSVLELIRQRYDGLVQPDDPLASIAVLDQLEYVCSVQATQTLDWYVAVHEVQSLEYDGQPQTLDRIEAYLSNSAAEGFIGGSVVIASTQVGSLPESPTNPDGTCNISQFNGVTSAFTY